VEEVPPSPATSGRRRHDRCLGGNRPGLGALAKGAGDGRTEGAGERVSGAAGAAQRGNPDLFWPSRLAAGETREQARIISPFRVPFY